MSIVGEDSEGDGESLVYGETVTNGNFSISTQTDGEVQLGITSMQVPGTYNHHSVNIWVPMGAQTNACVFNLSQTKIHLSGNIVKMMGTNAGEFEQDTVNKLRDAVCTLISW
jgi:hypothetical protein